MKPYLYGIKYIIDRRILGKDTPLICGLVLTNKCNLQCRHCRVNRRKTKAMSFEEAKSVIDTFYKEGGRTLYLEGGEPFLWKDNGHNMEDIVKYAHGRGYHSTVVYTNGTFPLVTSADMIFVSVDGLQERNDYLRSHSFDRIMKNIHDTDHLSLYINYTINRYNKGDIKGFCEYISDIRQVKGVFFYFHTPYYGYDELYIDPVEKNEIIRELIGLKSRYRILNSRAGLKAAMKNEWKRPLDICRVYEEGKIYRCCRYNDDPELCRQCGYLSYPEIDQTIRLKPSAIQNALKYF